MSGNSVSCPLSGLGLHRGLRPRHKAYLVLIWAGGVSNLIDRFVHHGLVTDFMVVRAGPLHTGVFNLADFAIVVGMLILVVFLGARPRDGEAHLAQTGANG